MLPLMYITNGYSGFIMSVVSDEEFEEEFSKIPEVKLFIEKYPNYTTGHLSDFLGWKIINYNANVGEDFIHLSVKKSVIHQGVKVSAGCSASGTNFAFDILDEDVLIYLKNDKCPKEDSVQATEYNSSRQIQPVLDHCDYQKKIESGEIPERNEDGSWNVVDAIGLFYQNSTHYIDNNICEWQYVGPATNSINKWSGAPIYKEQIENEN